MVGQQLIWGFDDFPVGSMAAGLIFGFLCSIAIIIIITFVEKTKRMKYALCVGASLLFVEIIIWLVCIYLTQHVIER
ncbi:MAG: hypothetical protein A2X48_06025 [Lentisphaerae bacterium GWF2_49_21]|nr:MAG: hypothetical protein A2X48_06025 [Lentisphaerae bacterium GWF2_49_21]